MGTSAELSHGAVLSDVVRLLNDHTHTCGCWECDRHNVSGEFFKRQLYNSLMISVGREILSSLQQDMYAKGVAGAL